MGPTVLGVKDVERVARRVLGSDLVMIEHHPVGFGNENWALRDARGCRYVLKVRDRGNEAKWRSSHEAYTLAAAAGLPVPDLVDVGEFDDHLVRIFTWIEGHSATEVAGDPVRSARFLASVGEAVRTLHTVRRDGFSSRLDGSAPSFAAWQDYIEHRLGQDRARCRATQAVDAGLLDRACEVAGDWAADVNDSAEAVLCHRDLHPDNLVVDADGTLIGILDWDAAEAWDRAGDWFKLEFDLLRAHPGGEDVLLAAYLDGGDVPPKWTQRRRLVHLVEALNILPNAISQAWDTDFADRARGHLIDLVAQAR